MPIHSLAADHISELERLGDEIADLSAHLDAATARLLALIREFDARGGWNSGFRSCAAWLSWRVGLDLGAARERVRVARALETLPLLAEALARGELSYAKVRALTRVATPETEARLLGVGRAGTAAHVERIVRGWRRPARPCISGLGCRTGRAGTETFPRKCPPWPSGRLMPWPCSRRRRCTTGSIPAPRGSATRWWSTSTPRRWPSRSSRGSRSSRTARAFPRKRPGAWRVMRAGW